MRITDLRSYNSDSSDRGVSPLIGLVLLFGIVTIGAMVILVSGSALLDGLETNAVDERSEQNFRAVDHALSTQSFSGEGSTSFALEAGEFGEYNVSDQGSLSVTAMNRFGSSCLVGETTLGTLEYENGDGDTIAYQAGGIWRQSGGQTSMMSEPDLRYYPDEQNDEIQRLDMSVLNLSGAVGQGEHTARTRLESGRSGNTDCLEDVRFIRRVTIEVEDTPYHDGWADFLEEEFDANDVDHDPGDQTVTVEAMLDYRERPFSDYVDVDPTIYGGLYAEDVETTLDESVTIDRYNGTAGWDATENVTEDLLVVNDDLHLEASAYVDGVPVVNEELTGDPGANVSSIAFGTDPGGELYEVANEGEWNETEIYNVTETDPPEVFGAKMSKSFDGIDTIDENVNRSIRNLGEFENASEIPGSGVLTSQPDDAQFYHENGSVDAGDIDDIDATENPIHVAVDGDLVLEDIDDIDGGNQTYFYVSGNITVDDVTIEEQYASNLWIYGTSNATVDVEDEFNGVVYAPGSGLTLGNNAEVYGALVGGETTIDNNATVHFDRTLRTGVPIPEENRGIAIEYVETRLPVDMTFVLDRSGSMDGNDEDEQRVNATKDVIGLMDGEQGDQAGVYEFNDEGYELHHLSGDLSSVNESVETTAEGATDMSTGMEPALDQYELNGSDDAKRVMILLSDGANDVLDCIDPSWGIPGIYCDEVYDSDDADANTIQQAERASNMNVTVYTVGLGDPEDLDEGMLQGIANETDGAYYHVDNASELDDIFVEDIGGGAFGGGTSTFTVSPIHEPSESPDEHIINVKEWSVEIDD